MISRRVASLLAVLALAACGEPEQKAGAPTTLTFSIIPAENQQSMAPLWQPLLDDLSKHLGQPVKPYFATNYLGVVEAMRSNQVQLGWFSALPALEAVRRSNGEVLGRVVDSGGVDS